MASRHSSFFGQQSKKSKTAFNRSHTANEVFGRDRHSYNSHDGHRTGNFADNMSLQKAPIEASVESKRKLQSFQFSSHKAYKHDSGPQGGDIADIGDIESAPEEAVSTTKDEGSDLITSTPVPRLPLADLVGRSDFATTKLSDFATQADEQLSWGPANYSLSNDFFLDADGNPRKRARSSSPINSRDEATRHNSSVDPSTPFGVRSKSQVNRTPYGESFTDLWDHYGSRTEVNGRESASRPTDGRSTRSATLQNLLDNCSSPLSPANSGRVAGLRRWASCVPPTKLMPNRLGPRLLAESLTSSSEYDELDLDRETLDEMISASQAQNPADSERRGCGERIFEAESQSGDHIPDQNPSPSKPHMRAPSPAPTLSPSPTPAMFAKSAPFESAPASAAVEDFDDSEFFPDDFNGLEDIEDLVSLVNPSTAQPQLQQSSCVPSLPQPLPTIPPPAPLTNGPQSQPSAPANEFDDEFGGDDSDIDDMILAEFAATQSSKQASTATSNPQPKSLNGIVRYLISSISEGEWFNCYGHSSPEKICVVTVVGATPSPNLKVHLRQSWYETPAVVGAIVHIMGEFDARGVCTIDNSHGILILHPDYLLSSTHVSDTFTCMRRAVLQSRVKAASPSSARLMYGSILHQLLQEAMTVNRWDTTWLIETLDEILPSYFSQMVEIGADLMDVRTDLQTKIPLLQKWSGQYLGPRLTSVSVVNDHSHGEIPLIITRLLDIEEHVWSPRYGLKGNVDATVEVLTQDEEGEKRLVMPFELKTGKGQSINHRAQTALYTLLLADRYDVDITNGLLSYLERTETSRVTAIRTELSHMLINRNELASYVAEKRPLPPVLKDARICDICYSQQSCFAYHKLVEDGNGMLLSQSAQAKYQQLVGSLSPVHAKFFRQWEQLLTDEEADAALFRELWTMTSSEREQKGRCFAHVTIEEGSAFEQKGAKINRFEYTLLRPTHSKSGVRTSDSEINVGEPIVISDERGHYCLAKGFVTQIAGRRISVAVDRRLHNTRIKLPGFDSKTRQIFAGIIEYRDDLSTIAKPAPINLPPIFYRLDKDEYASGMATLRNNLIQLMDNNIPHAKRLRSLIIELHPPKFDPVPQSLPHIDGMESMNTDQVAAVGKIFSAKDYALVLGMPGTGKTTTIAYIIKALVAQGKSVLLTSYTHTAVDNILLKVRDSGFDILRVGIRSKVHPDVQEFAILADAPRSSPEELRDVWLTPPVVASTSLGISHTLFSLRQFDYCIVDEASQITLPGCVGPIRLAETFILVGDHFQLPPLVRNPKALEGGLDVSLFKLLCESHPEAMVSLEHQYRMCSDIMELSNHLIYSGRLKCGTDSVATRACHFPNPDVVQKYHFATPSSNDCPGEKHSNCHLFKLFSPEVKVLFLNTDTAGDIALESNNGGGDRRQNSFEANLMCQILSSLLEAGCPSHEVGVVTFYRSQLALLRATMRNGGSFNPNSRPVQGEMSWAPSQLSSNLSAVEMHTADKFQGRDKEIVIVSFVRNNDNGVVGELLLDQRRVNVAVTRARSKLVMIGSRRTLLAARRRLGDNGDSPTVLTRSSSGVGVGSKTGGDAGDGSGGKGGDIGDDGVAFRLSGNDVLRGLVQLCETNGWMIDLPPNVLDGHTFSPHGGSHMGFSGTVALSGTVATNEVDEHPTKRMKFDTTTETLTEMVDISPDYSGRAPLSRAQATSFAGTSPVTSKSLVTHPPTLRETQSDLTPIPRLAGPSSSLKIPKSHGRINAETLLKSRPLMRDVHNNIRRS